MGGAQGRQLMGQAFRQMDALGADGLRQVRVSAGQQGQATAAGDGGEAAALFDGVGGAERAVDDPDVGGERGEDGFGIRGAVRVGEEQQARQGLGRDPGRA